ncbi:MAG: type II secretion system F family protein [Hyphomicrobiales bacterium]|nr:type II secretion system F family protein [Hyphomicrobiales bacterium]
MLDQIYDKLTSGQFLLSVVLAISVAVTLLVVLLPMLDGNKLDKRLKGVGREREIIRLRERERLVAEHNRKTLRVEPKALLRDLVGRFNLQQLLGSEAAREKMTMAGYRSSQAEPMYLLLSAVLPLIIGILAFLWLFVFGHTTYSPMVKVMMVIIALFIGMKLPSLFITNLITKRQMSIRRAFPDALDLLLICVESGMSIEQAFRKVATEIGVQSIPLAEELTLTTAELSYLQDRRIGYENLGKRTGLDAVKAIATVLIQAEKYGTPLGTALRVVSQEARDTRMSEAEKKAAGLPPKLTVPMIIFFLPVLFAVIITPAAIQVARIWK